MLSFKPAFSFSSFTFIKRLFSSSSLSAISVVLSAYLRLLIFHPAILIPACASSSPAVDMMYSAYKLNKQGIFAGPRKAQYPTFNLKCRCEYVYYLSSLLFHNRFLFSKYSNSVFIKQREISMYTLIMLIMCFCFFWFALKKLEFH